MHEEHCRKRRRSWYTCEEQSVIMKADTALTRHHLRCHFVFHDPRITVARNSTMKFHVKKPASKNSEFVARSTHKSVVSSQHAEEQAYFISQLRSTHYITPREPSVRKEPVYANWQAPCAMRHCCITKAHKNLSYLFTSLTNSVGKPDIVK